MIDRISSSFRISIYLLLGLSSITIGISEGNLFPHLLTLPLIVIAFFYLDQNPLLKLDSIVTSLLGIGALLMALWEFQQGSVNVEMRILAASHLLAYFTWIALLIRKQPQQYWWLMALSMLNMAVSAALTNSSSFGMSVIVFLFLAIWTLALFTAYRDTAYLRAAMEAKKNLGDAPPPESTTLAPPEHTSKPEARISCVRGGFHFDPTDNWLGYRLLGNVLYISVASMIVGMVLFSVVPRIWIGNFKLPSDSREALSDIFGKKVSGFTPEVRLGDMGEILDNPTPVMRVHYSRNSNKGRLSEREMLETLGVDELLFRGGTLSQYNQGRWTEAVPMLIDDVRSRYSRQTGNLINVGYELEPVGKSTLFVIQPIKSGRMSKSAAVSSGLQRHPITLETYFNSIGNNYVHTVEYQTTIDLENLNKLGGYSSVSSFESPVWAQAMDRISGSIEEEYMAGEDSTRSRTPLRGVNFPSDYFHIFHGFDGYIRKALSLDQDRLQGLIDYSQQLCVSEEAPLTPLQRCRVLHDHLKYSGEYSYTLDLSIADPTRDPVEDFLFVRKSGHCEYFASALTLMLRAVGIPARMVSGFKSGQWDEKNQHTIVQQRHAHAWVEAFVQGRWIVLDPTTFGDELPDDMLGPGTFSWANMKAAFTGFWQSYVLGVSLADQQNKIYEPIAAKTKSFHEWLMEKQESWSFGFLTKKRSSNVSIVVIYVVALFLPVMAILLVITLYLLRRIIWDWIKAHLFSSSQTLRRQQMLAFFRRFVEIGSRNGLQRTFDTTPKEYATKFGDEFGQQLARSSLEALPSGLTDAYYRARFRGNDLTDEEIQTWQTQLDRLAQVM